MFLRFLKKYWGCPLLILSIGMALCIHFVQKKTNLHLRYIPTIILVWLFVTSLILFALWIAVGIRNLLFRKEIYIKSAHITTSVFLSVIFCVSGLFITFLGLQPEHDVEKNDIKMIACSIRGFNIYTYYYEYVNAWFYGQYLGSEYYGDFLDISDYPIEWEFYDLSGHLIDRGSYNKEEDDFNDNLSNTDETETPPNEILKEQAEIKELNIEILENRENELVFQFSVDDYIDCYNGYYWKDHSKRYLTPSKDWQTWTKETSIHSAHETNFYYFKEEENVWTLPVIKVYTPTNANYTQEINLNYDWHSYTESMYELYQEMCFYTLKGFFPDFSDEQIVKLYSEINHLGYEHVFSSDEWYSSDSVPYAVFYKGNIGIYSYFAIGSCQSLCIIPVTQETIDTYRQKGAEIHEIP